MAIIKLQQPIDSSKRIHPADIVCDVFSVSITALAESVASQCDSKFLPDVELVSIVDGKEKKSTRKATIGEAFASKVNGDLSAYIGRLEAKAEGATESAHIKRTLKQWKATAKGWKSNEGVEVIPPIGEEEGTLIRFALKLYELREAMDVCYLTPSSFPPLCNKWTEKTVNGFIRMMNEVKKEKSA